MDKLQPVTGTHDLLPDDFEHQQWIIDTCRKICLRFGFREMATPVFEFSDVFHRTLGETSDVVSKETYTFQDRGENSLTLRPEGTAGIARAVINHSLHREPPVKLFYAGPMFRYERPQKGRQRQFHQVGIELLGTSSTTSDLETLSFAWILFQELGIQKQTRLEINSIGDQDSRKAYRTELVKFLSGHKAKLSEDSQRRLELNPLRILDSKDEGDQKIVAGAPRLSQFLNDSSKQIFEDLKNGLKSLNIPFTINERLVRGLDYYRHSVFEFKCEGLGAQDTICAGGRYDGLIESMGGPSTPAVGWAAGLERLALITKLPQKQFPVVALVPIGEKAEAEAPSIAHDLRAKGFMVDLAYSGNMSKRFKKAEKAGAQWALVFGDEELGKKQVNLKDLKSGEQKSVSLSELEKELRQLADLK